MFNYRLGFTFSFQGAPVRINYRNVKADSADEAIHRLLYFTPSAIKAWVDGTDDLSYDFAREQDLPEAQDDFDVTRDY